MVRHVSRWKPCKIRVFVMQLSKFLPAPIRRWVRKRLTIYVYTYGFRPSPKIEEQTLTFSFGERRFGVKANYRTALYDMIAEVADYDCYQLKKLSFRPDKQNYFVDIGANVGVTAIVLSQFPNAHVSCYEPDPENCVLLRENVNLNSLTNVKVFEAAVGSENGKLTFQTHGESTGGHLLTDDSGSNGTEAGAEMVTVDTVTLERAIAQTGSLEIDLLKCDCEGGEYALIDQITPELAARIRNLTIEIHDLDQRRNVKTISDKLANLGYEISIIPDMWERGALHLLLAQRR